MSREFTWRPHWLWLSSYFQSPSWCLTQLYYFQWGFGLSLIICLIYKFWVRPLYFLNCHTWTHLLEYKSLSSFEHYSWFNSWMDPVSVGCRTYGLRFMHLIILFFCLMVLKGGFKTSDFFHARGSENLFNYLLCSAKLESHSHLFFFKCGFSI